MLGPFIFVDIIVPRNFTLLSAETAQVSLAKAWLSNQIIGRL